MIVGFTEPKKSRGYFGALQLADQVDGTLVYAGRVGTGFDESQLRELKRLLDPIVRDNPPCAGPCYAPGLEPLPSEADSGNEHDDMGRSDPRLRSAFPRMDARRPAAARGVSSA